MPESSFHPLAPLFGTSDEQAMWRVQTQDDTQAFSYLVKRWEIPIQRLCTRLTGDAHRAEDLTQEAFARLFAHRKQYRPSARFSTFLWRLALNLCYDELRRQHRRGESSLDDENGPGPSVLRQSSANTPAPDAALVEQERSATVQHALFRLSEIHRTVLVLRHYENLKFREIAEVLSIPEGTVKSRMAEAMTQLTRLLEPEYGHDSKP